MHSISWKNMEIDNVTVSLVLYHSGVFLPLPIVISMSENDSCVVWG